VEQLGSGRQILKGVEDVEGMEGMEGMEGVLA